MYKWMCCGIFSCSHKLNVARSETFCCWKGVLIITCFVLIPFPHAVSFLFLKNCNPKLRKRLNGPQKF